MHQPIDTSTHIPMVRNADFVAQLIALPASALSALCGRAGEIAESIPGATCPLCINMFAQSVSIPFTTADFYPVDGFDTRWTGDGEPAHKALRDKHSVPMTEHLWVPEDAVEFTPPLSNVVYGDGQALFGISTLNDRPRFWLFRGDSSWTTDGDNGSPDISDFTDQLLGNLEIEFGHGRPERDDGNHYEEDEQPFPAIDAEGGCHWWKEA